MDKSDNEPKPSKIKKGEANGKTELFPNTLEGFGYKFDNDGKLRHIESGTPFEFKVSEEHLYNQKRYEALGEVLTNHVYSLLESETGLRKVYLPIDRKNAEPQTFIFTSEDALSNPDKLMLLIHGSGVVRAGQWARRLLINDCLNSGTQIPFIKKAKEDGYGVMVLNSNDNHASTYDNKSQKIRGSETPENHVKYVWENFVSKAKARHVAIIAHSYGGYCTIELVNSHSESIMKRVFAIALTDSVHLLDYQKPSKTVASWLQKVARNWVSRGEPLDVPIISIRKSEIPAFSAVHHRFLQLPRVALLREVNHSVPCRSPSATHPLWIGDFPPRRGHLHYRTYLKAHLYTRGRLPTRHGRGNRHQHLRTCADRFCHPSDIYRKKRSLGATKDTPCSMATVPHLSLTGAISHAKPPFSFNVLKCLLVSSC